ADALDGDGVLAVFVALGGGVDDVEHALGAGEGAAHPLVDLVEPLERSVELPEVADEGDDLAEGHVTVDDLTATDDPGEVDAGAGDEVEQGERAAPDA